MRNLCIILFLLLLTPQVGQAQFNDSEPIFGQMLNLGHWSTDGLVFYWRGIQAGEAIDESLYRNHGPITGATWVGQGLDFVGSGAEDNVNGGDLAIFEFAANTGFAFSVWVFEHAGEDNKRIIAKRFIDAGINSQYRLNTNTWWMFDGAEHDIGYTLPQNAWTHIVAQRLSDGTMQVYVNGVSNFTGSDSNTAAMGVNDGNFSIGYDNRDVGNDFNGVISNVSVYNRALSPSEIQQLYINPDLPMQQEPIWLMKGPEGGIVPIIQAHTRRRRAG